MFKIAGGGCLPYPGSPKRASGDSDPLDPPYFAARLLLMPGPPAPAGENTAVWRAIVPMDGDSVHMPPRSTGSREQALRPPVEDALLPRRATCPFRAGSDPTTSGKSGMPIAWTVSRSGDRMESRPGTWRTRSCHPASGRARPDVATINIAEAEYCGQSGGDGTGRRCFQFWVFMVSFCSPGHPLERAGLLRVWFPPTGGPGIPSEGNRVM